MQITIFGSTGQVGKAALKQALKSGYRVKVLVRSPDKLGDWQDKVEIVRGNLLDEASVEKALEGSTAVINAAGGVKEPDQFGKFQKIGHLLLAKMKAQGIYRLVSISGAVSNLPAEKLELKRRIMSFFVGIFFKEMKQSQEAITPIIANDKEISWTLVRAAVISDGAGTGKVLADDKKLPGLKIMLDDLGEFMVKQVTSKEWLNKAPIVASAAK